MKCPFEQMAEDAENDYQHMKTLAEMRRRDVSRGGVMWIAASCGYDYAETLAMLGTDWIDRLKRKYTSTGPYRPRSNARSNRWPRTRGRTTKSCVL